ncbi:MAG: hypothetical protein RIR18_285 [Pseudomonadota bacterium]|jgi:hypothetical protein
MDSAEFDEDNHLVDRAEAYISRRRGMLPSLAVPKLEDVVKPAAKKSPLSGLSLNLAISEKEPLAPPPLIHTQQPELPTLENSQVLLPSHETLGDDRVSGIDSATLKILVSEVSRNISRHLMSELPELLYNSTLSTLEADMRRGIVAATEVAARNFMAQRLHQGKIRK